MVLTQLEKHYGPQVRDFISYEEGAIRSAQRVAKQIMERASSSRS